MDPPEIFPQITGLEQMTYITELTACHVNRIELKNVPERAFADIENILDGKAIRSELKLYLEEILSMQNATSWKSSCTVKCVILSPALIVVPLDMLHAIIHRITITIMSVSELVLPNTVELKIKNFSIVQEQATSANVKSFDVYISAIPF